MRSLVARSIFPRGRVRRTAALDKPLRNYVQIFVELTSLVAGVSLLLSGLVLQHSFARFGLDFLTAASLEDIALGGFRIFADFVAFLPSMKAVWLLLLAWLLVRGAQLAAGAATLRLGGAITFGQITVALLVGLVALRLHFLYPLYSSLDASWDKLRGDCCVIAWPIELWPPSPGNLPSYFAAELLLAAPLIGLLLLIRAGVRRANRRRLSSLGGAARPGLIVVLFIALVAPEVYGRAMAFYDSAAGRVTTRIVDLEQCRDRDVYLIWSGSKADLVSCRRGASFSRYLVLRGQSLSVAIEERAFQRSAEELLPGLQKPRRQGPNVVATP